MSCNSNYEQLLKLYKMHSCWWDYKINCVCNLNGYENTTTLFTKKWFEKDKIKLYFVFLFVLSLLYC